MYINLWLYMVLCLSNSTDSNLRIDDDSGDESAGAEDPTSNDSG